VGKKWERKEVGSREEAELMHRNNNDCGKSPGEHYPLGGEIRATGPLERDMWRWAFLRRGEGPGAWKRPWITVGEKIIGEAAKGSSPARCVSGMGKTYPQLGSRADNRHEKRDWLQMEKTNGSGDKR